MTENCPGKIRALRGLQRVARHAHMPSGRAHEVRGAFTVYKGSKNKMHKIHIKDINV